MKFLRYALAALALLCMPSIAEAANRFAVCTVTCTWDNSSTAMWSASSGGATGASAPGSVDAVILDANTCVGGVTCTITINANLNVASITMGACTASTTGCILDDSVNNNTVQVITFSGTGITGTRTLKMGSNTWTVTAPNSNAWDWTTNTNATLDAGTSTLSFTATPTANVNFIPGAGFTYATVSYGANATGFAFSMSLSGSSTVIGTLNVTAPNYVIFTGATTVAITNQFTWSGASGTPILVGASSAGQATIAAASGSTLNWAGLQHIKFTTNAVSATNSLDFGGNNMNGGSITPPSGAGSSHCIGC